MKVVVQRVSKAHVEVENRTIGSIDGGLLVLVGFSGKDTEEELNWMANKLIHLRIFPDKEGKMNRSLLDVNGNILVVSQFTLYGNAKKGTRPSFIESAPAELAIPLYEAFLQLLKNKTGLDIQSGKFGAMMNVHLINEGPVTILLEK